MVKLNKKEQIELLQYLRKEIDEEAKSYCDELNINHCLLKTIIKPEGTISQLAGVSSGVHFSHSEYFIRRIRISSTDPLVKVCEELEYPIYNEVGQTDELCTTKIIEFPCKSPSGLTKYDVSAIEQLEIYKMFQENYTQHNTSITVSVQEHEWELVKEWMWDNWDSVIGVTFISLDDSFYDLMPYEKISKEEYEKKVSNMKPFIPSLLQKYEKQETELDIGSSECSNGACPIR